MTAASEHSWPGKRLRFLTQRGLSDDQRQVLASAKQAAFLPMEAIGNRGELDSSITCAVDDVHNGYTLFFDGDVLVAKITPCFENGKGALVRGIPNGIGFGTTELHVLRPTPEIDGRFLYYVTASDNFRGLGEAAMYGAAGQKRVPEDFVREYRVSVPPISSQLAIADYLDRETARLDRLVAEKERILRLLAEKRQSLITRAVTRGLDPDAPMRDSGIPWLGRIPVHWRTFRLRFLANHIEQGWSPSTENRRPSLAEWGVLKLNAVNQGRFDDAAAKAILPDMEPRTDLEIHAGDFLVTRSNTRLLVGDVCFVETTRPRLMLCDIIYRLRLHSDLIDGRFLAYFLMLPVGRCQIEVDARGTSASMVKISQEHIKDWRIPVPPVAEQHEILAQLAAETRTTDAARTATARTIALLEQRRSALISAAVTGQLDVGSSP